MILGCLYCLPVDYLCSSVALWLHCSSSSTKSKYEGRGTLS